MPQACGASPQEAQGDRHPRLSRASACLPPGDHHPALSRKELADTQAGDSKRESPVRCKSDEDGRASVLAGEQGLPPPSRTDGPAFLYTHTRPCTYTPHHTHTHTFTHIHSHAYTHSTHTHTFTHMHILTAHTHTHIHSHAYTHSTHTPQVHTCVHTRNRHTHTCMRSPALSCAGLWTHARYEHESAFGRG